jgi:hypothetical protein
MVMRLPQSLTVEENGALLSLQAPKVIRRCAISFILMLEIPSSHLLFQHSVHTLRRLKLDGSAPCDKHSICDHLLWISWSYGVRLSGFLFEVGGIAEDGPLGAKSWDGSNLLGRER